MKNINHVCISGNLTRDAEVLHGTGTVVKFTVAVNDRVKSGDEWTDYANFIDCVLFGKLGDTLSDRLKKGAKVCIDGKLRYSQWEKDGQKRSKVEIIAETVETMVEKSAETSADEEIPF